MTRAREALVLSGALSRPLGRGSLLELLEQAAGVELGQLDQPEVSVGHAGFRKTILQAVDRPPSRPYVGRGGSETGGPDEVILKNRWTERDRIWDAALGVPLLISPTDFHVRPAAATMPGAGSSTPSGHRQSVGTMVHRLLQYWRFDLDASAQLIHIERQAALEAGDDEPQQAALVEETRDVLHRFVRSAWYARIRQATVLGREMPFVMPWNGGQQIMEGVIDLLYRFDGQLWIADYKTDMIPPDQVTARAEAYREQARLYRVAVEQSLKSTIAGFEFIFLRPGVVITIP
jgi:ATP-dependent helicase/nuclease subunit A